MSRLRWPGVLFGLSVLALTACTAAPARVPTGASRVTFAVHPDMNVRVKPPKPATVTSPGAVALLAALINGLPPFPPGRYSCPADGGARLTLTFGTGPAGAASATATISLEGCEGVTVAIGARQVSLGPVAGGRQAAAQALKIAGLHWNLGRYTSF